MRLVCVDVAALAGVRSVCGNIGVSKGICKLAPREVSQWGCLIVMNVTANESYVAVKITTVEKGMEFVFGLWFE